MKIRQIIILSSGVLILVLSYLGMKSMSKVSKDIPKAGNAKTVRIVSVEEVANKDCLAEISTSGRLKASQKTEVFAEVTGSLIEGPQAFKKGTRFKSGELFFKIDDEEARLSLLAQKSALQNQLTSLLPDLKLDYAESYPKWAEYLMKFDPKKDLSELPEPSSEREKFYLATKNIYNQFYTIKSQEAKLKKYALYAPYNCSVLESMVNTGSIVRAGQKLGDIIGLDLYEFEASVPLSDSKSMRIGEKVKLSSSSVEGSWTGTIRRITDKVDESTQTLMVIVEVSGPNLKEGMYLSGTISSYTIPNAFEIPRKLLVNENQVYTVKSDSILSIKPIEVMKYTENTVIVKGLENGERIVREPLSGAYEGMKVKIAK